MSKPNVRFTRFACVVIFFFFIVLSCYKGRQRYLIRSGYFAGYCLTRGGASGWTNSALGIDDCKESDERQQWHFESVGEYFEVINDGLRACVCIIIKIFSRINSM